MRRFDLSLGAAGLALALISGCPKDNQGKVDQESHQSNGNLRVHRILINHGNEVVFRNIASAHDALVLCYLGNQKEQVENMASANGNVQLGKFNATLANDAGPPPVPPFKLVSMPTDEVNDKDGRFEACAAVTLEKTPSAELQDEVQHALHQLFDPPPTDMAQVRD